ncbi:AAA family ATPase [Glaesserella parasuis]|uniref:DNA recombination protein RecF n=1 Tax=Glaesserella parasuis HPS10 TaxID=1450514 RepID=A0A836MF94_GLAPU|nr:AAA family ATPase [Glaesserella parasuis]KDB48566.1 DNA recombination protein RecF [Glaesserella parasuis HPS10]MCT8533612.1 AAA family ATPase [Glaesserella parasuis]MCT8540070.1 AAA family ATPase [Glaesserella parasuis]MCT8562846.1 AAA family ATPase [Glaesserella parasuis]MCT8589304.1 AAA family ATPase [Glaesserella parasuis]
MFKSLTIENFSAFNQATFDFSKNINVFIGENGTGKTHVMKLIYCLQSSSQSEIDLRQKLENVFCVKKGVSRLVRRTQGTNTCEIHLEERERRKVSLIFDNTRANRFELFDNKRPNRELMSPVFIPVKEVLSFAPGFISLYDKYELAFEEIYYDIVKQAYLPTRKGIPLENEVPLLELIRKIVGGRVKIVGDEFQLSSRGSNLEMVLVAEGHRKLALIWQLIHNGSLFRNNTLFWDEPEANLNPSLMPEVAKILVMLAERGVQIFVSTHNYAFLKELEFAKKNTDIAFFSLEKNKENGVIVRKFDRYINITPNKIAEEYRRIYQEEIKRELGG